MKLICLRTGALCLSVFANAAHAEAHFKQWCDTFTAQGLISSAANRIYGPITSATAAENEQRNQWVKAAYLQAELRYKKLTGEEFSAVSTYEHGDWVARCQLKDQIIN